MVIGIKAVQFSPSVCSSWTRWLCLIFIYFSLLLRRSTLYFIHRLCFTDSVWLVLLKDYIRLMQGHQSSSKFSLSLSRIRIVSSLHKTQLSARGEEENVHGVPLGAAAYQSRLAAREKHIKMLKILILLQSLSLSTHSLTLFACSPNRSQTALQPVS